MPLTVLSVGFPLAKVSPRTAGGAEQVLLTLDRGLVERGHRSLIVAPAGSRGYGLLIPAEVPCGVLDENAKREARRVFQRTLERALARFSIDVVHMHGLDFNQYVPDYDVPVVVTLHLPLSWYEPEALSPWRTNMKLVCVSGNQMESAPAGSQVSAVVPNGIELGGFSKPRCKSDYALLIGRICPEKGFHLALEAAERAGVRVLIAGTVFEYPEHRAYFDAMIRPRLGTDVRYLGAVGGQRKAQLLAGAKCLLIPSQARETSSLVAMEAMAAGTPVIAWNSGALLEIVADGRTGFIVSSVQEMVEAIQRASTIDSDVCRREASMRFDAERMICEYVQIYETAAGLPIPVAKFCALAVA